MTRTTSQLRRRVYPFVIVGGVLLQVAALLLVSPGLALVGLATGAIADLWTVGGGGEFRVWLRRFGLGLVPRVWARAVLLLATVAPLGPDPWAAAGYGLTLLAVIAVVHAHRALWTRPLRLTPVWGAGALQSEPRPMRDTLAAWRRYRTLGAGLLCGLEVPLAAALAMSITQPEPTVGLLLTAGVLTVVLAVCTLEAIHVRRILRSPEFVNRADNLREAIADSGAEVVVYFSGDRGATYQLRQWVSVLERLQRPVLYLVREAVHLGALEDTRWPVLVARRARDVEVALAADPKVALYLGNAGRNVHFLRYGRLKHVFLNHGDSDKISSANPVVRVYDRLFVAGQVAIDRYRDAGIALSDEAFALVGRPQLDEVLDERRRVGDGPTTLLYAPTWEGYFEAADYSSVERIGLLLIERLLRTHPELRIVYKPHPLSGRVRPGAAAASRAVTARLREVGEPHVLAADHPELDLLDWFDRCDLLLADISAVVTDFLHTDKPYLVTNPRALPIEEFHRRFPSHTAAYVVSADGNDVGRWVTEALTDDPLAAARRTLKQAVLGDHAEGPQASFERALDDVVTWAECDRELVRNTFSYDDR
jgi:hypothetical protein